MLARRSEELISASPCPTCKDRINSYEVSVPADNFICHNLESMLTLLSHIMIVSQLSNFICGSLFLCVQSGTIEGEL